MTLVLKIGGNDIDQPGFLESLADIIAGMPQPPVIVHGGGKEISQLQTAFNIEPRYVDGLRVTDPESLKLVQMVLCGVVNPRIVALLQARGLEAQGLSGLDRGLILVTPIAPELERVGQVSAVKADLLTGLLTAGVIPVIAPIGLGAEGAYNVNADTVAGAVGAALGAESVVFLTNVPGVLQEGALIPSLTPAQTEQLIASEVISGGMIPKVRAALSILAAGVAEVRITNLDGLKNGSGTLFKSSRD